MGMKGETMKKLILLILASVLVLSISTSVYAIDKGTFAINPSSNFFISSYDDDRDFEVQRFDVDATVGYFIANNIELGLGVGFDTFSESGADDDNATEVFFSPYVEFLFPSSSNYFFAGARLYIASEENEDNPNSWTDDIFAFSFYGGYKLMLAPNIALDLGGSYVIGDFERSGDFVDDYGYNRINIMSGFKFYL